MLIDFIGHDIASLSDTNNYHRFLGGSPTNVALNASKIGLNSALIATCGDDGLGKYGIETLTNSKVDISNIRKSSTSPTSVILYLVLKILQSLFHIDSLIVKF